MKYKVTGDVEIRMNSCRGEVLKAPVGSIFCIEEVVGPAVFVCFENGRRAILHNNTILRLVVDKKIEEFTLTLCGHCNQYVPVDRIVGSSPVFGDYCDICEKEKDSNE